MQVWITDPQGTKPQPLVKEYPAKLSSLFWDGPAWSPDGSQIATVGYEGDPTTELPERSVLAIVTVASGEVTVVGELESSAGLLHSFPRWSPAGDAFVISLDHFKGDEFHRWEDRGHPANRCRLVEAHADHQGRPRRTPRGLAPDR
jgi:hypothetical protein